MDPSAPKAGPDVEAPKQSNLPRGARGAKVKNKAPAPIQITAEQILREVTSINGNIFFSNYEYRIQYQESST